MPSYKITDPQSGRTVILTGDSPPTEDELNDIFSKLPKQLASTQFTEALKAQPTTLWGKIKEAIATPERLSRAGLTRIAAAIPGGEQVGTGPLGIASNAAKAGTEALSEFAPGFVSPLAILGEGAGMAVPAIAPAIKTLGSKAAQGLESLSGLEYKTPGVLTQAAKDASLIFAKGKRAAGQLYNEVLDKTNVRPLFGQPISAQELIKQADDIANQGGLSPEEALIARQTLDDNKRSFSRYTFQQLRNKFDKIAKTVSIQPDTAYSRAVKAEALRGIAPTNKLGGTSVAKLVVGGFIPPVGIASIPLVQGAAATGIGLGARGAGAVMQTPGAMSTIAALEALRRRKLLEQQP